LCRAPASYFLNSLISVKQENGRREALGVRAGIFVVCLGVLSGCGGSRSSESGNLRFLQGSPDAPQVNLLVDGKSVATNIGYINATGYVSVKSGSRHVQMVPVSGASPVLDANVTIT